MNKWLYILGLCLIGLTCHAQENGGVYAAPGMMVKLQRPTQKAPTRALTKSVSAPAASVAPMTSPILLRFWQLTDSARNRAAAQLYQFASSQTKYPSNTLRAGIDGIIYVRLTIAGDGTVSRAEITRRILAAEGGDAGYAEKGKAALDAEVLRVAQALRFQPSSSGIDTVTIFQRFVMQ